MNRALITLPRLSSVELEQALGGDALALQRYRMLAALLHEGRSPGEVARTFAVSRETLRRLRQAVAERGLAGLRQRSPGGGHQARRSPLLRAVEEAMQAQPEASPTQILRQVRERLADQGLAAPRSTIYRLITRIQDPAAGAAAAEAADASHDLLRAALTLLLEDPPLGLGRSRLATQLVPYESDAMRRGQRLQTALRQAIEQLRPADETGPRLDSLWRPYLILAGEYQAGEDRGALQAALALSASTYSRAKRAGLNRVLANLPHLLAAAPPPAPPATLIAAPAPPAAFDRERELMLYQQLLQRLGLVLVLGPGGRGKSALASALAARLQAREQRVVWHTVRPGDEGEGGLRLLTALAAGLALHQRDALWRALVAAPGQPADLDSALLLLAEGLEGQRWIVAIDDVELLADALAARLLDVLADACRRGHIRLLLAARTPPRWLESRRWPALPPLDAESERQRFFARLEALLFDDAQNQTAATNQAFDLAHLRERVAALQAALPPVTALDSAQLSAIQTLLTPLLQAVQQLHVSGSS